MHKELIVDFSILAITSHKVLSASKLFILLWTLPHPHFPLIFYCDILILVRQVMTAASSPYSWPDDGFMLTSPILLALVQFWISFTFLTLLLKPLNIWTPYNFANHIVLFN